MKAIHNLLAPVLFLAFTAGLSTGAETGPTPIPFSELAAKATANYKGDAIGITADGAQLHTAFRKLTGTVTREGLRLECKTNRSISPCAPSSNRPMAFRPQPATSILFQ